MHPALAMKDILNEIFQNFQAEEWLTRREWWSNPDRYAMRPTTDKISLRNAALTCRCFSGLALDHLWCTFGSKLAKLLKLLPAFKRCRDNSVYVSVHPFCVSFPKPDLRLQILDGAIGDADWVRFEFYAMKVKNLTAHLDLDDIDPSVFSHIVYLREGRPLFPALRNLDIKISCSGTILPLFLSSRLLSIALTHAPTEESAQCPGAWSVLHALPTTIPGIHTLSLDLMLSDSALNAILRMTNLQHLHLLCPTPETKITYSFFWSLASLPKMVELSIPHVDIPSPPLTVDFPSTPFPCLNSLSWNGDSFGDVIFLLEVPKEHGIKFLKVESQRSRQPIHRDTWLRFFRTISTKFSKSLSKLHIEVLRDEQPPVTDDVRMFEPLLELHELEEFNVMNYAPWATLQDADLLLMAKAWPKICVMHLQSNAVHPKVTFHGLHSLASFCPHLCELWLPIDASSRANLKPVSLNVPSDHPLWYWNVGKSLIDDPALVASRLDKMFPNLCIFMNHDPYIHNRHLWNQVARGLPALRNVRRRCSQKT
ncbi:hypothetical protein K443DRAFT_9348 [Laccaria amethystina LaAM-08-1]|uniref:F-box domain-containing protein n=1 Tax=Laccaria amethystina LaAM-08-1 TaxID=1095629 RepID=A0A0C9XKX3_9AGAR|nr:hypothetical protein K443DRAFT_14620 [Laccaria amethystina LaAM-08-1]KIJ98236.1 hypothetical protein K443DRAFT_9348 [Laccaria amethystina LaAM-08-1]